jgi:sirohydrochlorin ferrochelatase
MRSLLALMLIGVAASARAAATGYGILLLAHGGDPGWNQEIARVRAQADVTVPTELALGMADPATLQKGLDALAARGVSRVVAVPLFVHSRSEVLDQTRYVLGLSDKPSEVLRAAAERMAASPGMNMPPGMDMHMHMFSLERVKTSLKIALAPALDDAPLVSRILLERARALSRDPKTETVVLVAHGPVDDAALGAWRATLARHAQFVRREGGFKSATSAVLRDDAAPGVRAAAVADLRSRVAEGAKRGRALVVPVLIARGGIEAKLPRDLQGLDYAFDAQTLMPHDGFARWILDDAARTAAAP